MTASTTHMNAKKRIIVLAIVVIAVAAVGAGCWSLWSFYHQNLRGIGPAILPPKQDIAQLIDTREVPLTLPKGFSIGIFAKDLGTPRVLVADPNGVLIASDPSRGQVLALPDKNGDGKADETIVLADKLNRPHGLAFRCLNNACRLYVAEENAVSYYDYDATTLKLSNRIKIADLPSGGEHVTRSLLYLPPPDDRILVAIGSDCNVCHESNPQRASILSIPADGGALTEYATGLRNTVFMTIDPATNQVWGADMGRDFLGDNTPPDEINILEQGKNYGWPICYGDNVHDTAFDKNTYIRNPCMTPFETSSHINIPAHSAPLGLAFATGTGWAPDYAGNLFVSYHGSWNRITPTGYKVVRYVLNADGSMQSVEDFITGWLQSDGTALGRPTGLLLKPDGQLFVADDKAGVIYRIYRTK